MYRRRKNSFAWWVAVTQMRGPGRSRPGLGFARGRLPRSASVGLTRATCGYRMKKTCGYWMNSPHFWTAESADPQGMMGTEEVEFLGDPSISLSEYTM